MLFPEVATVRSPRVAPALLGDIVVEGDAPPALATLRAQADVVVIATGAWAGSALAELGVDLRVEPRGGQMMLFASGAPETVVMEPATGHLAVPRADGRVVVGTTLEDAGFRVQTLAPDMERMEAWARRSRCPGSGPRRRAGPGCAPGRAAPRRRSARRRPG